MVELLLAYKADVILEANTCSTAVSFALNKYLDEKMIQDCQAVLGIQNRDIDRVETYQNIIYRLLAVMTSAQLARAKAASGSLDEMVTNFEIELEKIQTEISHTLIALNSKAPFGGIPDLVAHMMQFYSHPIWYHHRMDKDVEGMLSQITSILEKRPKAISFRSGASKRLRDEADELDEAMKAPETKYTTAMRSSRAFERTI